MLPTPYWDSPGLFITSRPPTASAQTAPTAMNGQNDSPNAPAPTTIISTAVMSTNSKPSRLRVRRLRFLMPIILDQLGSPVRGVAGGYSHDDPGLVRNRVRVWQSAVAKSAGTLTEHIVMGRNVSGSLLSVGTYVVACHGRGADLASSESLW